MATVTYDNRSFVLDGRRIWLISGTIHYFRVPARLWRDRLLKARRGGLNCIETYVAWNFHEPMEGKWDFTGDHDVVEFIRQAADMGLYVIIRPGPYICAEWDAGGFPSWLRTKSGLQYRTNNAIYTHYYDKYFRQILPRLAELQVSRGGNIVAIQNENEYFMTTMPDRQEYLDFITQMIRRAGFDIPILTCNWLTEPMVEGAIECNNSWDQGVSNLRRLRHMQPDTPLLTTEFWPGWFDWWGEPHHTRDDRESARRAMELVGAGSQVNYYMYHGGTNFGFWAGRSNTNDHCYITTSYDYDAPIAEGGGLTHKYYLLRLVNLLNRHMGDLLAAAIPLETATTLSGVGTLTVAGPQGRLTVVTNNGDDSLRTTRVVLHDGRVIDVDMSHFGAVAVVDDVPLTDAHMLDYSNLMPLGFFGGNVLVLHGLPGQAGVVSINGQELKVQVPAKNVPLHLQHQGLTLLVMPSSLAQRCWPTDGVLVIGPDFVGDTAEEVVPHHGDKQYLLMMLDSLELASRKYAPPTSARKAKPPALGAWRCVSVCEEPNGAELDWRKLDRPRDLDTLGVGQGYGWYKVKVSCPRAARKRIFLPQSDDRVLVWANGQPAGTWGRGPGAQRTPLAVELHRGENTLTFLADNMGRFNFGPHLGEPKGIWGDVFADSRLKIAPWKSRPANNNDFSRRVVPRNQAYLLKELQEQPLMVYETTFTLSKPTAVSLRYTGLDRHVAVLCNDHPAGFFGALSGGFADIVLSSEMKEGVNRLKLLVWRGADAQQLANVHLHLLEENLTAGAKWQFRSWMVPTPPAGASRHAVEIKPPTASHPRPAWYACTFKAPPANSPPLFLNVKGAEKGQIFLNGHDIGRYWTVGPQPCYYLPSAWLIEGANHLQLFSETGRPPKGSLLEFKPLGPYGK